MSSMVTDNVNKTGWQLPGLYYSIYFSIILHKVNLHSVHEVFELYIKHLSGIKVLQSNSHRQIPEKLSELFYKNTSKYIP